MKCDRLQSMILLSLLQARASKLHSHQRHILNVRMSGVKSTSMIDRDERCFTSTAFLGGMGHVCSARCWHRRLGLGTVVPLD